MEITIPSAAAQIKDEHGNVMLEADLFDLSHFIGHFMADYSRQNPQEDIRNPGMARLQMFKELATQFNTFFNCNITFSRMSQLTVDIESRIQELKKKVQTQQDQASSTSPDSQDSTDSLPQHWTGEPSMPSTPVSQS